MLTFYEVNSTISLAGISVEPVSTLVKHSCDPNSWFIFEGKQMRLRALKDIAAGTQLTRCYFRGDLTCDQEAFKRDLKTTFEVDCNCSICQRGNVGPTGSLMDRVRKFDGGIVDMSSVTQQRAVDRAIKDMLAAGFGYNTIPMRSLYQHALRGNIFKFKTADALKNCLKIYYLVEPNHRPAILPFGRINTLFNLVSLLDIKIEARTDHMKACDPLPQEVTKLLAIILFHLKAKLVREEAKWFGSDTNIARSGKFIFEDILVRLKIMSGAVGKTFNYTPLSESATERVKFVKAMNELLKWADIPAMEEKDLI